MLLEIVLAAVLVLAGISGFAWWIRLAGANARAIGAPPGDPVGLFRGGVMCRHLLTSGSLARLEFFDWGVRLRGDPHAIGFLTMDSRDILTLLQDHDVPVNRSIVQVRRVEELYR